jgi:spermidine/putrescine-binding protein
MSHRLTILLAALALALLLGVPALYQPAASSRPADVPTLVIITPHNEQIRHEISHGFARWHQHHFNSPAAIDWRAIGGTSDIERQLLSQFASLARSGSIDQGTGYDIVFGGGDFFFDKRLKPGVASQPILLPVHLPPDLLASVYPQPTLAGKKLHDPDLQWWGVVLSTFGIVHNPQLFAALNLPAPNTWSDLSTEKLIGNVAMADPSHSGSVRVTYDAILQWYGFDRGIATLRRMAANSRYFSDSASRIPLDVSSGEAAAGVAIDFYGKYQSHIVGPSRLQFTTPPDATVVTADPVAILRGTKNLELSQRFIQFLLSRDAQALWNLPPGDDLGPIRYPLGRMPIRPDIYTGPLRPRLLDPTNPYDLARPLPPGTPSYFRVMPTLFHAMAMHVHHDLRTAWQTIADERDPQRKAAIIALFDELPFTQQQLLDAPARWKANPDAEHDDRIAWTTFFRDRYRKIAAMK